MDPLLIELHFLPSLEYFTLLQGFDTIILEKHEHFGKQSFRNRCYINTAQGKERLTIPLKIPSREKVIITDVGIDNTIRWQTIFSRTLQSAYANAPFYEHYVEDIKKELFSGHRYLYDLNFRLLSMCLQWLRWKKNISESVAYEKSPEKVFDARSLILAKKDFSERKFYQPHCYQQVFGNNFVSNLSLMDVIFCEGPMAANYLTPSQLKN